MSQRSEVSYSPSSRREARASNALDTRSAVGCLLHMRGKGVATMENTTSTMRPIFTRLAMLVPLLAVITGAYKQCAMPGGNAGECRYLKECKPLNELNNKRVKTENELLYIKQSQCGITSDFQYSVCCPPEQLWNTFNNFTPLLFNEIVNYETVLREKGDDMSDKTITTKYGDLNIPYLEGRDKIPKGNENPSATLFGCGKDSASSNRIIGGGYASYDQYPWLVLLEYDMNKTLCGGSLITTRYVLTAAHCIERAVKPQFARLSEYNTTTYPTDYIEVEGGGFVNLTVKKLPIEKNIAHPNYNRLYIHHDIGLSKLARDAVLGDYIRLICLPSNDLMKGFREPMNFTVAGWGHDGIAPSDVKKHVKVPFVNLPKCRTLYALRSILDSQICAGGRLNEDSCSGDSGGPLMYENENTYVVVGIVSYGPTQCGTENVAGVYTYVYSYLDWLRDNMD